MITPWFCTSLRTATLILSAIDGLGGVALLGLVIHGFYTPIFDPEGLDDEERSPFVVPFISCVIAIAVQFALASILFYGAKTKQLKPCRIWLIANTLLVILKVVIITAHIATGNHCIASYGLLVDVLYQIYTSLVVIAFMVKELQPEDPLASHFKYSEVA